MRALLELLHARRRKRGRPKNLRTLRRCPRGNRWRGRLAGTEVLMSTGSSRSDWYGLATLACVVLVADQTSKYAVQKFTQPGAQRVVIPGLINLVHTTNPG